MKKKYYLSFSNFKRFYEKNKLIFQNYYTINVNLILRIFNFFNLLFNFIKLKFEISIKRKNKK